MSVISLSNLKEIQRLSDTEFLKIMRLFLNYLILCENESNPSIKVLESQLSNTRLKHLFRNIVHDVQTLSKDTPSKLDNSCDILDLMNEYNNLEKNTLSFFEKLK